MFSMLAGGSARDPPTPVADRERFEREPRKRSSAAGPAGDSDTAPKGRSDRWSTSYTCFDVIPVSVKKEMLEAIDERECAGRKQP